MELEYELLEIMIILIVVIYGSNVSMKTKPRVTNFVTTKGKKSRTGNVHNLLVFV